MAAVATPTIVHQWNDGHKLHVIGTIAVSNSTYATNGIALSFAGVGLKGVSAAPQFIRITGVAGFIYAFTNAAATLSGGLMLIFVNNSGGTNAALPQHTTATVVSGVQTDTITFYGIWRWGV